MKPKDYYRFTRREMLPFLPETARRILDVGCATGVFGSHLKTLRPMEVWGIEPHAPSAAEAARVLDHAINDTFGPHAEIPRGHFDAIFFNDVLEHLPDPAIELRIAKTLLAPGGCVIASIPNIRHIHTFWNLVVHRWAKYDDSGVMDRTHLRIFTKSSIEFLFAEAGYKIQRIEGINGQFIDYKYYVANLLTLGRMRDTRWLQYAVVAHPE